MMEDYNTSPEELFRLSHEERLNLAEIAKLYNLSVDVITRWMKESNIKPSLNGKFTFNEKFFNEIDTEEKAYWLGFVWCDGYLWDGYDINGYKKYKLTIDLQEGDIYHLEKFRIAIESKTKVAKVKVSKGSKSKNEFKARFGVGGSYICKVLINKYGMVPYRTNLDLINENIPHYLIRHFIRGVLDADGSITHCTRKTTGVKSRQVSFTVTPEMGDLILDYLLGEKLIKTRLKLIPDKVGGLLDVYGLGIGGGIQAERVLDHLYKDSTVYLERKHDVYISFKKEKGWAI